MKWETKIKVTFITPVLGMEPPAETFSEYIAPKNPEALEHLDEEEEMLDTMEEARATTIFHKHPETGEPCTLDYHWKGLVKEKCKFLRLIDDKFCSTVSSYKQKIDGLLFIKERYIVLTPPEGKGMDINNRILRAETRQGPRTTPVSSEMLPEGTTCVLTFESELDYMKLVVKECLDHCANHGTGGWRSGGWGRFTYEILEGDFDYEPKETKRGRKKKEEEAPAVEEAPATTTETPAEEAPAPKKRGRKKKTETETEA